MDEVDTEIAVRIKKRPLRAVMKKLVKIMATCHEMGFRVLCLRHALRTVTISTGSIIAIVSRCDSVHMKTSGFRI